MASSSSPTSTVVRPMTDQSAITANNRGPITSAIVLPAECTDALTFGDPPSRLYFGHSAWFPFDPSCVPWGTLSYRALATANFNSYYYSPAICPIGWTDVTTFTSSSLHFGPSWVTLRPGTTAALCCPSKYKYTLSGHICGSIITPGQKYTYISPVSEGMSWVRGDTIENRALVTMTVEGDGVPIWWQQSDEAALSRAATMTPTSQQPSTSTQSQISTPASTLSTTPTYTPTSGSNDGISMAARIGLGVGIPLAIIAALALGLLLWRRRRSRAAAAASVSPGHGMSEQHAYVAQPAQFEMYTIPAEMPSNSNGFHELPERAK